MLMYMLNPHDKEFLEAAQATRRRFMSSAVGSLTELKLLLRDMPHPIEAGTGAQIAQMLRAIREAASNFQMDAIAHSAANIEMYLLSCEFYGLSGELRNFVLGSRVEELALCIADTAGLE